MNILEDSGRGLLLGNEAIVRGLIEAGVRFASTYPGTPSSEIGNILEEISEEAGMYFEFSSNEKIALEVSAAAASAGVRSFAFMKHVGLNVAADPLMTLAYSGVVGGMLVLSADDPSAHSSQNEQDNRYFSTISLLPMIEPSTPAEAKDMIKYAYEISEELTLPVIYRTTTRVNHARSIVEFGPRTDTPAKGHFTKDDKRFVNIPAFAKLNRIRLLELNKKAQELSEMSPLNRIEGTGDIGIITSGVSYTYVKEFTSGAAVLKLGFTNPLPEKKIAEFIKGKKFVIIVEELDPFLEDQVLRICAQNGLAVPIYGKRTGHLPREWEYSPDTMKKLEGLLAVRSMPAPLPPAEVKLPNRPATLCAGCPHRGMFAATKKAVGKRDVVYCTDIGCYTLGLQPPFHAADFLICMGGGAGAAGGFDKSTDQKAIAFIGDSTFFHSGITGLVNAVFNRHNLILAILDNGTTAMTGHQPNPGVEQSVLGNNAVQMDIEAIVRGCGVEQVTKIRPYNLKATLAALKEAKDKTGVRVIIAEEPCVLFARRTLKKKRGQTAYVANQGDGARKTAETLACPAFYRKDGDVLVDEALCTGCMVCMQISIDFKARKKDTQ